MNNGAKVWTAFDLVAGAIPPRHEVFFRQDLDAGFMAGAHEVRTIRQAEGR
jgi:hypothetical protein